MSSVRVIEAHEIAQDKSQFCYVKRQILQLLRDKLWQYFRIINGALLRT